MKTSKKAFIIACVTTALLSACSTPKNFNYMQELGNGEEITTIKGGTIRLQPHDQISIIVKSKDPVLGSLFNKGLSTPVKSGQVEGNPYLTGYTIGDDGSIDFPVLGKIALAGKTRYEAEQALQQQLRAEQLKDANVTIEFMNLSFTVTGEVNAPGVYPIRKDATTLLEALGDARDINVYGKRDSVMVIRHDGQKKKAYIVNMNSARSLLNSEAYYIQQNDVIYVKANNVRVRQSTASGNETRSISFWLTMLSVLSTMAVLIFK